MLRLLFAPVKFYESRKIRKNERGRERDRDREVDIYIYIDR